MTNHLARTLKYGLVFRKVQLYWGICGRPAYGEIGGLKVLAEGEELGSNLLRVAQRSPAK